MSHRTQPARNRRGDSLPVRTAAPHCGTAGGSTRRVGFSDRRAHQRQHRGQTGARGERPGLPVCVRHARQGQRGEDSSAAGVRRGNRRVPRGGAARPPRLVLLGVQAIDRRDPGRVEPESVREPAEQSRSLPHDRPEGVVPDRRPRHALRDRGRHGGHDQRRRPLPEGGQPWPGARHRRRARGLGLHPGGCQALPRRGRRARLRAGLLRPDGGRPDHRRQRPATPSAGHGDWLGRRRCWWAAPPASRSRRP